VVGEESRGPARWSCRGERGEREIEKGDKEEERRRKG
jgi:hypothetical protein